MTGNMTRLDIKNRCLVAGDMVKVTPFSADDIQNLHKRPVPPLPIGHVGRTNRRTYSVLDAITLSAGGHVTRTCGVSLAVALPFIREGVIHYLDTEVGKLNGLTAVFLKPLRPLDQQGHLLAWARQPKFDRLEVEYFRGGAAALAKLADLQHPAIILPIDALAHSVHDACQNILKEEG